MDSYSDDEHAYDHQQAELDAAAAQGLPLPVKSFITALKAALSSANVQQLAQLYSVTYPRITSDFYPNSEWPEAEVAGILVDNDEVFLCFYRELFYRHIYSRLQPELDDRFHSYENYCSIFNYILNSEGPVPIELPAQWMWDILDEFVYQFASFSQWRSRTKGKSAQDIEVLAGNNQTFSCYSVLNVLYSLVQKSQIQQQLQASKNGADVQDSLTPFGQKQLYKTFGLYSLLSLVRVHVLLGDYTLALKTLSDVNLATLPKDVPAAYVSVYYYLGVSYLMLNRPLDAITALSKGIASPAAGGVKRGWGQKQDPAVAKMADRMLALLCISWGLVGGSTGPAGLEDIREVREGKEAVRSNDKYGDFLEKLLCGGDSVMTVVEELFRYGAPKTISPNAPNYESGDELPDAPTHQVNLFLSLVRPQLVSCPDIKTLLKLYTTLGLDKAANLLEVDLETAGLKLALLKSTIETEKYYDSEEGLLASAPVSVGNLGFGIDNNTLNMTESRKARQYTARFLAQGLQARQALDQLKARPLPTAVYGHGKPLLSAEIPKSALEPKSAEPVSARTAKSVAWAK